MLSQAIALVNESAQLNSSFKYHDALNALKKALTIREEILGVKHSDTMMTCNKIAAVYSNQGE